MIEWQNIKDKRPKENQIVLASINGVYKIARFDEAGNRFIEVTSNQSFSLNGEDQSVYWSEIETPIS